MYKKILSLSLVLLMVFSCFAVSVSAYSPSFESVCENAFINYLKKTGATYDEPLAYFNFLGDAGCLVFQASAFSGDPVAPTEIIGNYRFTARMCMGYCDTNPAGMYAFNGGELMTLKEAYDKGLVDLDLLYESASGNSAIERLSDEEILKNKCKVEFVEEYNIAVEDGVSILGAVKYLNYTVFVARYELPFDGKDPEREFYADGYWFYEGTVADYYTLDNYGNVEKLEETADKGFIDLDEIFPTFSEIGEMHLSGDIDGDKKLTVKDATLIQKYLAKYPEAVETVWTHSINFRVADADLSGLYIDSLNDDSAITINDATYIQKKVARKISDNDRQPFEYGEIIVAVKDEDEKVYTLEDFPEYEFESVERAVYAKDMYILTLKNSGKENVIDAVNSLKYREGVDISYAQPNYLDYYG
ncbi:MAG: dockerin type I repeat-containing protein [Clostridia bacterium]|nr:dockerin type I repeat-containing protein [Clostridia bacterium]